MKKELNGNINKILNGFAAGVMVAASIWSLIIPSVEQSSQLGHFAFLPAVIGFWLGTLFLLIIDDIVKVINRSAIKNQSNVSYKTKMMIFAITLHNIPEGMAVGAVWASILNSNSNESLMSAFALALGIAIQNFPEGAIVSIPLHSNNVNKTKSFIYGTLSGIVEPISAIITLLASSFIATILPYLLSFAGGAMIYVVVDDLIPEMAYKNKSKLPLIFFIVGFTIMMAMDIGLG